MRIRGCCEVIYLGLDLGRWQDFSALAIVERLDGAPRFDPVRAYERGASEGRGLVVRHVERMELETPYTEVVRRGGGAGESDAGGG